MVAASKRSQGWVLFLLGVAFLLGWWLRGDGGGDHFRGAKPPSHTAVIGITHGHDGAFERFLEENGGQIVFISTFLDLSVSLEEAQQIAEQFQVHRFLDDATTPLPLSPDGSTMLALELIGGRTLSRSHGGTGIVQVACTGYFRVSRTLHAGPAITYHLREIAEIVSTYGADP